MESIITTWVETISVASPEFILAQCLSLVALGIQVVSGQMAQAHIMLRLNGMAASCLAIHFLLMGIAVAAVIVTISAMRSFSMSTNMGRRFRNIIIPACISLAVCYGAYLAKEPWMLVCLGGPVVWGTAEYIGKTHVMRPMKVCSSSFWLFNNIMSVSIGGVIMNLMVMSSYGLATIRQMNFFAPRAETAAA